MNVRTLHGVIPPVPTILHKDGSFDPEGMRRLITRLLASDIDGLLFLGSAGEFAHLSMAARKETAEFCVKEVAGRRPVIIGTAACATAEVIELNAHAASIGADAVMIVNPYYAKLTDDRIYQHYRQIAEASALPVLLYNFPALTGQDLSVALVKRLAEDCPNIIGIKDTIDCMSHVRSMIQTVKAVRPDFLIYCGYDEYMLDTLLLGGAGAIPATSNFAPEITCGIYKAVQAQDYSKLPQLVQRLGQLCGMYSLDSPFTGLIKEAIRCTGSDISTEVAAPASKPSAELIQRLKQILDLANVAHT